MVSALTAPAQQLRELIAQSRDRAILLPGVHDALSAKIFQQQSAECLFLSGFGVSASFLGAPDAGILTLCEMEDTARRVVNAVEGKIPVLVDGDTGYGGCSNMRRAIRGLARAGAAAISIEDQIFPKKCTYSAGENGAAVVSRSASIARIKTALAAAKEAYEQDGNDVLIIARSDCRASEGLEQAISRCLEYEELGADIVYAENLQSPEEYQTLRGSLAPTTPTILAQVQLNDPNSEQRLYSLEEVHQLGYNLALFGVTALQATVHALQETASAMRRHQGILPGSNDNQSPSLSSFSNLKTVVGFPELEDFEREYFCE
ncbi:Carboxyvinyl-carboxyphosphonate phosphorylmutase [Seminavis robusta]|uniref:Carboxyvinyl-carboxyphosphonate phosphorylmutase n=1 Tax=Seminavis robusta TaxID=568900 RepID=A0A9N8DD91_9STRA|nr:Carboxyvinyl-carboxyphosphonate phosphorylmutase [Seminavis robusta]|eukprot:Sro89_g046820.1 Carboxyvinyl-carboxyphosphonate phosphorylmutase (318) ;mRNA; f:27567-28520